MQRKSVGMAFVLAGLLIVAEAGFGDDETPTIPRGSLGSGARLRQPVSSQPSELPVEPAISPLRRGIGQIVSGWTRDGIHGQELATQIHQLQGKSFDDRPVRRSRDRSDRYDRDRFEDRKEFERDRREDRREADRDRGDDRREERKTDRDRDGRDDRRQDRKETDRNRREDRR
jgi:hypothetical protein